MEDRGQQLDTNSFFVSYLGEIPDSKLSVIAYAGIRFYQWEISGERRKFAEVTFNSISEAEQAYNKHNGIVIEGQQLKFLVKRAMTTLWLSGLPSVVYNRDLFTGLQDLTPGLSHLSIPPHPE